MFKIAHNASLKNRLRIGFLILCFGVLTGFSPLLHNHELDIFETDHDCAPCNWSQSQTSVETVAPEITTIPTGSLNLIEQPETTATRPLHTHSGRSPPAHS